MAISPGPLVGHYGLRRELDPPRSIPQIGAVAKREPYSVLKSHSIAATIALLVALGGCGETTAPNKNFSVSVAIDGTPAWNVVDSPNGPVMTCTAGMTVTGHGNGRATWTGASEYYFIGADRSTSVDTTHNPATDLASAFGVTDIGDGESRRRTRSPLSTSRVRPRRPDRSS